VEGQGGYCFDFVNEKSKITQERLYSEEREKGRAPVIMKEIVAQQKSTEKHQTVPNPIPCFPGG
jgi:hypothetical protein